MAGTSEVRRRAEAAKATTEQVDRKIGAKQTGWAYEFADIKSFSCRCARRVFKRSFVLQGIRVFFICRSLSSDVIIVCLMGNLLVGVLASVLAAVGRKTGSALLLAASSRVQLDAFTEVKKAPN